MKLTIQWKFIYSLLIILVLIFQINAGGGGGSRYVNTGSYDGPKRSNVSIYEPLLDHIFEGYNPLAIPICSTKKPLHLMIDMWLYQLFDLDEPRQELIIDVWIDLNWKDCSISWNPAEYNNIKEVVAPAHEIWHPDIFVYQGLHGNYEEGMFVFRESKVKIQYNGVIQLGAQILLRTFCRVEIAKFPFDSQICPITFSAWNKDLRVFNMTMKPKHGEDAGHSFVNSSNGEWNVTGLVAVDSIRRFHVGTDESELENFSEVTFTLHLKRKPGFIKTYLVFPCLLLIWVASITFILPVSSGEKIGLISTILLSLFVFLLIISEYVPHTSDSIPLVAKFFFSCIGLVSVGMIFTVIVLNISHRSSQVVMPTCFQRFLYSSAAQFFCFSFEKQRKNFKDYQILFRNSANATTEISPTWTEGDVKVDINRQWDQLAQLFDRVFLAIYVILCTFLSLYILTAK